MKKSAPDGAMGSPAADRERPPADARERLLRAFLRELPAQLEQAGTRLEIAAQGKGEARDQLRRKLHRLKSEAVMLHLPAHSHLLAALEETVGGTAAGEIICERIVVAARMALRACEQLGPDDVVRAEQEAAQLRWLTQDSDAIVSGVFPSKLDK